jgi:hypothetical protein
MLTSSSSHREWVRREWDMSDKLRHKPIGKEGEKLDVDTLRAPAGILREGYRYARFLVTAGDRTARFLLTSARRRFWRDTASVVSPALVEP